MTEHMPREEPKVAWIYFSETRPDAYETRKPLADREVKEVGDFLGGQLQVSQFGPVRSNEQARRIVREVVESGCNAAILHLPIFTEPSLVALVARLLDQPVLLLGNQKPDTSSFVGLMAAGGVLDQMGYHHRRVCGSLGDAGNMKEVVDFCWASAARNNLRGQAIGAFGGISLGIMSGSHDPVQWLRLFGVRTIHFDQLQLVERARSIPEDEARENTAWLLDKVGLAEIGQGNFTENSLDRQIRSYLAVKGLAAEKDLDFVAIKCQSELSDGYALQCVNHMLLNDPYDADGAKSPIVASCETDMDGALTMQVLKLLTGGGPVCTMDLRLFQDGVLTLVNCGGMPSYFAARSDSAEENLGQVHLRPHVFGKAGGAATQFVCAPGPVTFARLQRRDGNYELAMMEGSFLERPREELKKTTWPWPHGYFEGLSSYDALLANASSNHFHAVSMQVGDRVREFCRQLGIPVRQI